MLKMKPVKFNKEVQEMNLPHEEWLSLTRYQVLCKKENKAWHATMQCSAVNKPKHINTHIYICTNHVSTTVNRWRCPGWAGPQRALQQGTCSINQVSEWNQHRHNNVRVSPGSVLQGPGWLRTWHRRRGHNNILSSGPTTKGGQERIADLDIQWHNTSRDQVHG